MGTRWVWRAVVVSGFLAGGAAAEDVPYSAEATETCLAAAGNLAARRACIGRSAEACAATPDGQTTVGTGACYAREHDLWDARLNAAYGALMAREEEAAAELGELGSAAPSPAAALRDMQRTWIAYRDAACLYEVSQWGGGTGGGPAGQACMMEMTGEQALALEERLAARQAR